MKKLLAILLIAASSTAFAADIDVVAPSDLTSKPSVVKSVSPEGFPSGKSALVAVEIVIDRNGSVIDAKVKKSTDVDFEPSALEAIKQWKFTPGKKGETSVATRITVPFRFEGDK